MIRFSLILASIALFATQATSNEFEEQLKELAESTIMGIAQSDEIVAAIIEQNKTTASFDQAAIDELDQEWRAEIGASRTPLIDDLLGRAASEYLMSVQADSDGLMTEIFVMDAKGLNVAQSDITSDYWQGDEAKWQDTFGKGADAIHISEVEEDESTQTFQSQVSMSITDPADGSVIGAITVGVNVEFLE